MIEKMCPSGVRQGVRWIVHLLLSKFVLLPGMGMVPGLKEFVGSENLEFWLVGLVSALLCGLFKQVRDRGVLPSWLPL